MKSKVVESMFFRLFELALVIEGAKVGSVAGEVRN
jgi:hypothetical protein